MISIGSIIAIVVFTIIIIWLISMFNSFVRLKNEVKNAWSQIDVQLKRRNDLIPNLINTVKGYAKHEKETFENVTKARTAMINAGSDVKEQAKADNMLTGALKSVFAVAESYPDLKANQNFIQLQEELTGTEDKIAATRRYYNDTTMEYNTKIESFPDNIIAKMFSFTQKDLFKIEESEKAVPKVEF